MATCDRRKKLQALCVALALSGCVSGALAGDLRDLVFDCPCSAEWVAGEPGEPGTLRLRAGIVSHRATESGELWLTRTRGSLLVLRGDASAGRLPARHRERGEWMLPMEAPEPGAVIEVQLMEQTSGLDPTWQQWLQHERLTLWPVPGSEAAGPMRFVDLLTDSDGDGVGDVNERLAGFSPEDAESTPGDSVIDVLPLYDAEFREAAAGHPHTFILHVMSVADTLFEDNNTGIRLRIVGASELEHHGEFREREDREREDRRQVLMDAHGADIAVWFSQNRPCPSNFACASVGAAGTSHWREALAYVGFHSALTVAHELGHVMGLAHSALQGETHGAWRWSRGHFFTNGGSPSRFGTIMSYGLDILGGVFSNPETDCGGSPCGVAAGELDGADSVRTLDLLRFQIAANRTPAPDADGDGFVDAADALPDNPGDWLDSDSDGIGDNTDPDDDNDGVPDLEDPFPLNPEEWADVDGDGIGDNADDDVRDLTPFRDPQLRRAVEASLGKGAGAPITAEDMAELWRLRASKRGIRDLAGLELATGLEELHLDLNDISDLSPLAGLTKLKKLYLNGAYISDLSPLVGLTELEHLWLFWNDISDLSPLSGLVKLERLLLDHNDISDLSPLSGLTRLRSLDLGDNDISDLSPLSGLTRLRSLDLDHNDISDLSPLSGLTELGGLDLDGNDISDLSPLSGLARLITLSLSQNGISDSDLSSLSGLTGLLSLSLDDNDLSDLLSLSDLTELTTLSLDGNDISDLSPLSGLTRLRSLSLDDNDLSDLSSLAGLTGLEELRLWGNDLSDLSPLSGLTELEALGLWDNKISDLSPLSGLTELEHLQLGYNRISDLSPLSGLTGLRNLYLNANGVSDLSPLSGLTGLEELGLTINAISDIGPLLDIRFATGAVVDLKYNLLNNQSILEHIPMLRSRGIKVSFLAGGTEAKIVDPTLRKLISELTAGQDDYVGNWISVSRIRRLKTLRVHGRGIETLAGLDAAANLQLFHAASNRIVDLSPLAELPYLTGLDLGYNRIVDLSPLVANAELGEGDWVALDGNPLSEESLNTHIPALLERGVDVSVASVQLSLAAGGAAVRFDVRGYFKALLGYGVRMMASSSDLSLVEVEVEARTSALVFVPGKRSGSAVVTVEATDGRDTATLTFAVRVRGPWLAPLFPNASGTRQGFVRVVNHSPHPGLVDIVAVDDAGLRSSPLALFIGAGEAVHFNSDDFEAGNPDKGLSGSGGTGAGDWWLHFDSGKLELEVLSYVRTADGFVTAMHDVIPKSADGHRVPFFNPASNLNQVSLLRVTNLGFDAAEVTIAGIDARGESPGGDVRARIAAGATLTLTAGELEAGGAGLEGRLGDGVGKWRLLVNSEGDLSVMNLLLSPEGYLSNLSTSASAALLDPDGTHHVPLFPSTADPWRQGFVRVLNRTGRAGVVRIQPYDDAGLEYDVLTLALDAHQTAHFNSDDLELGAASKGLSGRAGSGTGDWRLELSSDLDIEALAYVRTAAGFLTSMHNVARRSGPRHEVSFFNPASNTGQVSSLRIVNPSARYAHVSVVGVDDRGVPGGGIYQMIVPPKASNEVTVSQLEGAADDAFWNQRAQLGDGAGKWRLMVDSEQPVLVMSLLASPTGHLTNLSTTPARWVASSAADYLANNDLLFPDNALRNAIGEALGKLAGEPVLANLRRLDASDANIQDLTGLELAENLEILDLDINSISDLSPLASLTGLTTLDLFANDISDLSPLSGMTGLTTLTLSFNDISDLSPLSGLTGLRDLSLSGNDISDLSPLSGMTGLTTLNLSLNDISDLSLLSGMTGLTTLFLSFNDISDLSPLSGLAMLRHLFLTDNNISDISALSALTGVRYLDLETNQVSDIAPLVTRSVWAPSRASPKLLLTNNPLSESSIEESIPELQSWGIVVRY